MRIYCDMDDILCETAATLCGLADRLFGVKVDYESVGEFNLQNVFKLTDAEMREFSAASHSFETLMSYPETPGAVEGLKALRAAGHTVEIVTGRPSSAYRGTEAWLRAHDLGDFPVIYVDKYARPQPIDPSAPRMVPISEFLREHYDVAIDDSPVALKALEKWTNTDIIVFDRPWNRLELALARPHRLHSWTEILNFFHLPPCTGRG